MDAFGSNDMQITPRAREGDAGDVNMTHQHQEGSSSTSLLERFLSVDTGKKKGNSMQRKLADMMAPFIPGSKNSPRAKRNSSGTMPNESASSKAALKTAVSDIAADINAIPAVHDASMLSPAISAQDMLSSAFDAIRTKQSAGAESDTSISSAISGQAGQHAVFIQSEMSIPVSEQTPAPQMSIDIPSAPATPVSSAAAPQSSPSPALLTPQLDRLLRAARHCALPASPRAEPPPGSPAGTPNQTTLLALSNSVPPRMARNHWCLADYVVGDKLYTGYASTVYKATCKRSGEIVVLKIYTLAAVCDLYKYQIYREVRVHASLTHENIVTLYAAFQEGDRIIMVQEYADGRDLFTLLHKYGGKLSERLAVQLVLDPFLRVLHYLHTNNIIHRDIKPENILFTKNMVLKLGDFGLAIDLREERAVTRAGTLDYMAPEVLRCPYKSRPEENKDNNGLHYGARVDAWAVGVLTFELLAGYPPFFDQSRTNTEERIVAKTPEFPAGVSDDAKSFINWALSKSATQRPTIFEMLNHTWVEQYRARRSMRAMQATSSISAVPAAAAGDRSSLPESAAQAVRAAVNSINQQVATTKARMAATQSVMAANNAMQQAMGLLPAMGNVLPAAAMPFIHAGPNGQLMYAAAAPGTTMMVPVPTMVPVAMNPAHHIAAVKPAHLSHLTGEGEDGRVASAPSTPHMPIAHACAYNPVAAAGMLQPGSKPSTPAGQQFHQVLHHAAGMLQQPSPLGGGASGSSGLPKPSVFLNVQSWQDGGVSQQQGAPAPQLMARSPHPQ